MAERHEECSFIDGHELTSISMQSGCDFIARECRTLLIAVTDAYMVDAAPLMLKCHYSSCSSATMYAMFMKLGLITGP